VSAASSATSAARTREWLALSATPGLGPTRIKRLLERFGDVGQVFRASLTELEAAGIPAASAQSIVLGSSMQLADEELEKVHAAGAMLLVPDDPAYPRQLLEIYDPPAVLRVRGDVEALSRPGIAIVGTRHPTPYGLGMAERLACDLAARGLIILSGMARGVDSAAHRGAVNARAKTVAVFGTGIDIIYPRENQKLSEQILAHGGTLISEFPMGAAPTPQNFPIRNRVISGLSRGVLVVEAGEYSGTRITARCALEQCREVFAVPGNVTNKLAWGPNTLIKQGAKLVATWEDVWEELPTDIRLRVEEARPSASNEPATASLFEQQTPLEGNEKKVYALIKSDEAIHIDQLVEELEGVFSSSEIFAALFELELAARIRQLPGKNYVRTF
jgi:DNA processing protein